MALLVETSLASGREILRGVARYVRERGAWSLFHWPHGLENSAPAWLAAWKGHGIIARITTPELGRFLAGTGLPVVDVLGLAAKSDFPLVHVDDAAIAKLAFSHLAERGLRRFAFFGLAGENWSERRREAFLAEARSLDPTASAFEIGRKDLRSTPWENRQDRLAAWLRRLPKPAGLMVCSDQLGPDALDACRRSALAVPDQIAVIGVDNDEPLCEVCNPPLSSVVPDHFAVGFRAAELLDALMSGGKGGAAPRQLVSPSGAVARQSSDVLAVEDRSVAAALRIIRERACEDLSVAQIARLAGASRSVLQRRFIAALGQTIHDQIVHQRLKRATELIAGTALSLAEIAERCGFKHQEYMGVVFRKRLGKTPGQFRPAHKPR